VPAVPESLQERSYKPSGKCTPGSLAAMLGLGVLLAVPVGAIAAGINWAFNIFVLGSLLSAGTRAHGCGVFMMLVLAPPSVLALVAILSGVVIDYVTRWSKCRNPGWAAGVGFLDGTAACAVLLYVSPRIIGGLTPGLPTGVGVTLSLVAACLVLVGASTAVPYWRIRSTPFCESCRKWYTDPHRAISWRAVSMTSIDPLLQAVVSGSIGAVGHIVPTDDALLTDPCILLKLRRCELCGASDYEVTACVAWTESTRDRRGVETVNTKRQHWFTTMVSCQIGKRLERILFPTERLDKECQRRGLIR
jgi:hypothetical protein